MSLPSSNLFKLYATTVIFSRVIRLRLYCSKRKILLDQNSRVICINAPLDPYINKFLNFVFRPAFYHAESTFRHKLELTPFGTATLDIRVLTCPYASSCLPMDSQRAMHCCQKITRRHVALVHFALKTQAKISHPITLEKNYHTWYSYNIINFIIIIIVIE